MDIAAFREFIKNHFFSDVSHTLTYHGLDHTLYVLETCNAHITRSGIEPVQADKIRVAALLHDTGIFTDYFDHEQKSAEHAREILPQWGFGHKDIVEVCHMIMATHIPQKPLTLPEMILCDSDVDYLGTDQFYTIGIRLYKELKNLGILKSPEEWDFYQARFLLSHTYHTPFAIRYREPVKKRYLTEVLDKYGWKAEDILAITPKQKSKSP